MAGIDLSSLGNALTTIGGTTVGDIASQAAMGLLVTGAIAGFQSPDVQNKIDFLHIFHKDGSQTVVSSSGKTISAAALKQLDPAAQTALIQAGYTVVG